MKNYSEMAESVLKRRDEYDIKRKITMNKFKKGMAGVVCGCCLALLISVGVAGSKMSSDNNNNIVSTDNPITKELLDIRKELRQSGLEDVHNAVNASISVIWQSADEILEGESTNYMGVCVPSFIAYRGGFYGCMGSSGADFEGFAPIDEVWLNPKYSLSTYMVKDNPDCIAVILNDLQVYKKMFDVTFELDGVTYGIAYRPVMNADYTYGDVVKTGEGFAVYQVVSLQGEEVERKEYFVNILPLLKEKWPQLFGGEENYAEAWQVAVPINNN